MRDGLTSPDQQRVARGSEGATRAALLLLGALLCFRVVYASQLGLAFDEAYYWQWSRHLDLSYYDSGPGIAWVIRFGTLLLGDTLLGIRIGNLLLGAGASWFTFLIACRWASSRAAFWAILLLNVTPLLAAGTILATYDVPQVFCWTVALYLLTRAVQEERPAFWYGVGLMVGLGVLCKLTMLLFAPCALVFLLVVPAYRKHLATPHPYLAFLLALALCSPILIWNLRHDWIFFTHVATLSNRSKGAPLTLRWFGEFWGGQALVLGPALLIAELRVALFRARSEPSPPSPGRTPGPLPHAVGEGEKPEGDTAAASRFSSLAPPSPTAWGRGDGGERAKAFFLSFFVPILLLCAVQSIRSRVEPNWPVPMHVTAMMAVGLWFSQVWESGRRAGRVWISVSVGLSVMVTLLALFPGVIPVLFGPLPAKAGVKINEPYGWPQIADRVQAARKRLEAEGREVFVSSVNYRVNSILAFYVPGQPRTQGLYLRSRRDQYFVWTRPETLVGKSAVLVFDMENKDAEDLAKRYFTSVTGPEVVEVVRPGFVGPTKTYYIYECRDFKGYDPNAHADGY